MQHRKIDDNQQKNSVEFFQLANVFWYILIVPGTIYVAVRDISIQVPSINSLYSF